MSVDRKTRILTAAEQLAVKHGFRKTSMSQVAVVARVAKGTAYSYWPSKEALFAELISLTFKESLVAAADAVRDDASSAAPGAFVRAYVSAAFDQPLIRALHEQDPEVLGDLMDNEDIKSVSARHGAPTVVAELVPVWRSHGEAQDADTVENQVEELKLVVLGYFGARQRLRGGDLVKTPDHALERAVTLLLGFSSGSKPTRSNDSDLATHVLAVLDRHIAALES